MRNLALAVLLVILLLVTFVGVNAQQQTTPPDISVSQTNASIAIMQYKAWLEGQFLSLWTGLQSQQALTATLPQDRANIQTLQNQVADLQQRLAVLEAANAPAPIHIDAENATNISASQVQSTQDTGGGNKVVLLPGMKLNYSATIVSTGNYVFSARLSTDPSATGTFSGHFESPAGTNVSGALGALTNGAWITYSGTPAGLTAGTIPIVFVVDSVPAGGAYINWFEVQKK